MEWQSHLVLLGKWSLALAVLCLFACPRPAAADPVDVVTLHFTGSLVCDPTSPPCSPSTGTVTGTFSVDPDTASIVGPWSFSTPFGTLSSSAVSAGAIIFPQPSGAGPLIGMEFFTNGSAEFLQVFFVPTTVPGEGAFVPGNVPFGGSAFLLNGVGSCNTCAFWDFTAVTTSTTPEPSSLLLLGTGLLGLGTAFRRRLALS